MQRATRRRTPRHPSKVYISVCQKRKKQNMAKAVFCFFFCMIKNCVLSCKNDLREWVLFIMCYISRKRNIKKQIANFIYGFIIKIMMIRDCFAWYVPAMFKKFKAGQYQKKSETAVPG